MEVAAVTAFQPYAELGIQLKGSELEGGRGEPRAGDLDKPSTRFTTDLTRDFIGFLKAFGDKTDAR